MPDFKHVSNPFNDLYTKHVLTYKPVSFSVSPSSSPFEPLEICKGTGQHGVRRIQAYHTNFDASKGEVTKTNVRLPLADTS